MGQRSAGRARREHKSSRCAHDHTLTTFVAGLARSVCESCGNVSIRYLGEGAVWPDMPFEADLDEDLALEEFEEHPSHTEEAPRTQKRASCKRCEERAYFITPWGLACSDHAWEAASKQDPLSGDFWIPLLVDRSDIPS